MCDAAWAWAASHNRLRTNAVHQEEEAQLILSETFELLDECGQEINMSGEFQLEATQLERLIQPIMHVTLLTLHACSLLVTFSMARMHVCMCMHMLHYRMILASSWIPISRMPPAPRRASSMAPPHLRMLQLAAATTQQTQDAVPTQRLQASSI